MKAAIVTAAGKTPVYGEFETPAAKEGETLISVRASALSNFSKARASGEHYSSDNVFPRIAGSDGVGLTPDGKRVYFVLPEAPYGALAEFCPVDSRRLVEIPDGLDDLTAAAIANPGMSVWGSLMERAKLVAGETVLVNGATGTAGRLAVQMAKYLGASKVIATGRNAAELEEVRALGADVVIPFALGLVHPSGAQEYEEALKKELEGGVDVVVDYLWGESAKRVILAIAKTAEEHPVRFVHTGGASREAMIELPGEALRASAIALMGSGAGSVGPKALLHGIQKLFEAVGPAGLKIATKVLRLAEVAETWEDAAGKPRLVYTVG